MDRSEAQQKSDAITSTTFVFNTISSPRGVAHAVGIPGRHPSIYLGISPRWIIEDSIRQQEYVAIKCLLQIMVILTDPSVYNAVFTMAPGVCKTYRDTFLMPFIKDRPMYHLANDPRYEQLRPPMAIYWNSERASQSTPVNAAMPSVAGIEAFGSAQSLPDMQGHGKDEGSIAGPSNEASTSASSPEPGQNV